jgi:hypothetical protein
MGKKIRITAGSVVVNAEALKGVLTGSPVIIEAA